VQLQGSQGGFGIYNLAIKRDFADSRGSIGFGAENFFTPEFKMKSSLVSPVLRQNSVNTMRNMGFRINFSYRIGKLGNDQGQNRRSRRSVNNDDLKTGGDGGIEGGGPEMQMGAGGGRFNGGGGRGPASTGAPQAQVQTPAANPEAVVEAEGKWAYVIESPQGGDGTITIVKDGESLSGT